ncbi:SDR family oxidoreductase [Pseudaestuariivita atlantica]|uniref:3-ketoacyl-ACP reductase n=1 Tax=Pseudaestuariivita atlantica TaxID=1317121 RepID=A0A0L1JRX7_9RHOB|nr:SDR family oxidoreductase [Pseudaestuariivita atlantica]KNG94549.1 3-ketoacyl-ACP reductase [Pseudaestuariivita atlantica]
MRIALTGGATGIGASVLRKLAGQGHEVVVFDIAEPADHAQSWICTDISNPDAIDAALAQVEGRFDGLVNNAGLPPRDGLEEAILRVNFLGLRRFLDGMVGRLSDGASVVNVASRAGAAWRDSVDEIKGLMACDHATVAAFVAERGIDPVRAYNLSKEAVIALTLARTEAMVARGLRINSVSPAAVSTGILDDFTAAFGEKVARNIARAGRAGEADEVADVILFLLSPQSHWIKGQDIVIDGGMTAMAMSDALGFGDPA